MTIPVSVNLIVRNCAATLDRCLASLGSFFADDRDELIVVDTGSTDDGATAGTARKYGANVIERPDLSRDVSGRLREWLPEWVGLFEAQWQTAGGMLMDFAAAREIAREASRHDCLFWIDSDDTLREERRGALRAVIEQGFRKQFDALFLDYEYVYDEADGRCTAIMKRERVVDRGMFRWQGRCHETLVPIGEIAPGRATYYRDLPVWICHTAHRANPRPADVRNYLILRTELEEDLAAGRVPDVRTRLYLGNACRGLGLTREALEHYDDAVGRSTSAQERYAAQLFIAEIHLSPPEVRPEQAVGAGLRCIGLSPADPRGHFIVSRACAVMGRWEEALQYFEAGRKLPMPDTTHILDPEQVTSLPLVVAAEVAIRLGRLDYAHRLADELLQRRPDWPDTHAVCSALKDALVRAALTRLHTAR